MASSDRFHLCLLAGRSRQRLLGFADLKPNNWIAGTSGTVGAVLVLILGGDWSWLGLMSVSLITLVVGIFVIPSAARWIGESVRHTGEQTNFDHRQIVIDEWLGMFVGATSVYVLDMNWWGSKLPALLVAFGLFRFFDGKKPLGIKWVEKWFEESTERRGLFWRALGVMVDDLLAGLYVAVVMSFIHFYATCIVPLILA